MLCLLKGSVCLCEVLFHYQSESDMVIEIKGYDSEPGQATKCMNTKWWKYKMEYTHLLESHEYKGSKCVVMGGACKHYVSPF